MPIQKIVIVFMTISALAACAGVDEQWFYSSGAELQEKYRHNELSKLFAEKTPKAFPLEDREFVVKGHRIVRGGGSILAFRSFDRGSLWSADSSGFLKITAFVPDAMLASKSRISIPNEGGAMAFLSTSSSSFPGVNGCFGYASEGTLNIDEVGASSIKIFVDIRFRLSGPPLFQGKCEDRVVRGSYVVPQVRVGNLTPWQGIAGRSIYEETSAR